jgi:WD40 repeat protein/tRNA A-37 threonylcarbamoyl transferase component Bud32
VSAYHKNALQVGSQIAEYRVDAVLGHGGFGITYLAQDTTLNALVAVKEFLPHQIAIRDEKSGNVLPKPARDAVRDYHWGLKNFVKEARALAQFKHPNIVRVLRFIEANGTAYMVMEYEKGESLSQHLKNLGARLDETGLLRIFIPILNGLHAVHEAQMLHLDIKPENIYLRSDGSPMLIDFGSARQAFAGTGHVQRVALTHGYAPLEQYPDKGKQGPWTDIYAIGASMYRCVTGKQPDDSLERYQAFLKYKVDPLTPASKIARKYYQPSLLECIDWAMQIYPNDRPQTARALQDALIGKGRQSTRKPATITGPATYRTSSEHEDMTATRAPVSRIRRSQNRRSSRGWLVLLLMVLALGAAMYLWMPDFALRLNNASRREPARSTTVPESYRPPAATPRAPAKEPAARNAGQPVPVAGARPQPPTVEAAALGGHKDWVTALAFSPGGHWFVSGSNDKTLKVWEIPDGKLLGTLQGHGFAINSVAVSPDDLWIASAGNDGSVRLWEVRTGKQRGALQGQGGYSLFAVAFSPDGKSLAAAGRDRTVFVWDVESGKRLHALEGHKGDVNALSFSPNGQWLASAGADRTIRVWNLASGKEQTALPGHRDSVLALAYSPDGRWLASGDNSRTIRLWNASDNAHVRTYTDALHPVLALAFSHDGNWLAVGEASKSMHLIDTGSSGLAHQLDGHQDFIHAVAFSPDGRWLITGGRDQLVRLWQPKP